MARKPTASTSPTPSKKAATTLRFGEALDALLQDGTKVTRQEWYDPGYYLILDGGQLKIHKPDDNLLHTLIVTDGDIAGNDWVILTD